MARETPAAVGPPSDGPWSAEVRIGPLPPERAGRLWASLLPESSSGVPGSPVDVGRPSPDQVELRCTADGTPGIRAALNAHLRWVDLALRTDVLAATHAVSGPASSAKGS